MSMGYASRDGFRHAAGRPPLSSAPPRLRTLRALRVNKAAPTPGTAYDVLHRRTEPTLLRIKHRQPARLPREQLPRLHLQRLSDAVDVDQADIALSALDLAEIGAVEAAPQRHLLLRQLPDLLAPRRRSSTLC